METIAKTETRPPVDGLRSKPFAVRVNVKGSRLLTTTMGRSVSAVRFFARGTGARVTQWGLACWARLVARQGAVVAQAVLHGGLPCEIKHGW